MMIGQENPEPKQSRRQSRALLAAAACAAVLAIGVAAAIVIPKPTGDLTAGGRHRIGNPDAPVQLVVFSDFQCQHCARFNQEVIQEFRRQAAPAGQAAVSARHYPFLGPESQDAAIAAECAAQQERFWEYHDLVYQAQRVNRLSPETLTGIAATLELELSAFAACLRNPAPAEAVKQDYRLGQSLDIPGTPAVFVNGRLLPGHVPRSYAAIMAYAAASTGAGSGPP